MTESNKAELYKFNKASQKREFWERREIKIHRLRSQFTIFFISLSLIVTVVFMINSFFVNNNQMIAGIGYAAMFLAGISLIGLMVVYFKSFTIEMEGNRARKAEGILAENVYRALLKDHSI